VIRAILPLVLALSVLTGTASWYDARPGTAAAGPALRRALGPGYLGTTVAVCHGSSTAQACVKVRLVTSCQCYRGEARERLIDLSKSDFAQLAPLSKGLVKVTVRIAGPAPTPPATDTPQVTGRQKMVPLALLHPL
jgi:hypothetical protein